MKSAAAVRPARVNFTLKFYDQVLRLGYIHYGLWAPEDPLTLEGLRTAQERYADKLIGLIPNGVSNVLDVGCGTGGMALKLKEGGLHVTGVSPDPYQEHEFRKRTGCSLILSRFEDVKEWPKTDLILMAESVQYIPVDAGFARCAEILRTGGWILASDYFTKFKDGTRLTKSGHLDETYRKSGERSGFRIESEEDISQQAVRTLELAHGWAKRYAEPAFDLLTVRLRKLYPRVARLGMWLFRKRLAGVKDLLTLIDPAEFLRTKNYRIFLWQKV